jgi:hypothetical protein
MVYNFDGWVRCLRNADPYHYFRNNHSLCGWLFSYEREETPPDLNHPLVCPDCRKLASGLEPKPDERNEVNEVIPPKARSIKLPPPPPPPPRMKRP